MAYSGAVAGSTIYVRHFRSRLRGLSTRSRRIVDGFARATLASDPGIDRARLLRERTLQYVAEVLAHARLQRIPERRRGSRRDSQGRSGAENVPRAVLQTRGHEDARGAAEIPRGSRCVRHAAR